MKPEGELIAISRADGGISIMFFVTREHLGGQEFFEREPSAENINAEIVKAQIEVVSWRRVKADDIPADRTFRNAWTGADTIGVDMVKARGIHRDRMRAARGPLLKALDTEYLKYDEGTNDNGAGAAAAKVAKKAIAAQKQALRDVTDDPAIEAAQSPEELKAVWPFSDA